MAEKVDVQTAARHDANIEAWFVKYGNLPEPAYAKFVDFNLRRRLTLLNMSDGRLVELPLDDIQGLAFASPAQLHEFEMLGRGTGMDWPSLGVSFSVQGLLEGSYGNQLWMQALQRRGDATGPERKPSASRTNSTKVGKPRKVKPSAA